jgi:hypothetical protein
LFILEKSDRYQAIADNIAARREMDRMRADSHDGRDPEIYERFARDMAATRRLLASGALDATPPPTLKAAMSEGVYRLRFRLVLETEGMCWPVCHRCDAVPRISVQRLRAKVKNAWGSPTRTVYLP